MFFAGKGGVGKTTCAAGRAVAAAGAQVLIVSTDPAHSLGDALGTRLSARPRRLAAGRGGRHRAAGLSAVELDASRAFARWLEVQRPALAQALEHGTWLDREDIDALLRSSVPGVDELIGLMEIKRLAMAGAYDLVVVDTAPTGHTLRLLAAPRTVEAGAGVLDLLQREHRTIRERLGGAGRPEAADRLIAQLRADARESSGLLRDPSKSTVHWVLLPEDLALAESEDGLAALSSMDVPVAELIVNRVLPDGPPCPLCDRRRVRERQVIAAIPGRLGACRLRIVPALRSEPRGFAALGRIGRFLTARSPRLAVAAPGSVAPGSSTAGSSSPAMRMSAAEGGPFRMAESFDVFQGARLLLFGGKGGAGKTTCAAATALRLARANPRSRLLLLSIDPAHSLADVLARPRGLSSGPAPIRGAPRNLDVQELDAASVFAARRASFEAAVDEIAKAAGAGGPEGTGTGTADASALLDLKPPGLDEVLAMLSLLEARHTYALIVVDTAPTGHVLRLLEMPGAARSWVQTLMRVLLKYRTVARADRLAAELIDLSKSIRHLDDLLHRPRDARFIVVSRAADLPRLETRRLLARLRTLGIGAPAVVVNAVTMAPTRCAVCRATASAERAHLAAIRQVCRRQTADCVIILTPLAAPAPRGLKALEAWSARWTALKED